MATVTRATMEMRRETRPRFRGNLRIERWAGRGKSPEQRLGIDYSGDPRGVKS
jgi:hypothetical protein